MMTRTVVTWGVLLAGLTTGEAARADGPAAAARPAARVAVTSDHTPTTLFRVDYLGTLTTTRGSGVLTHVSRVCEAPCTAALPVAPDVAYYVDGPGLTPSRAFTVCESDTALKVAGGSATMQGLGVAALALGVLALTTGGGLWGMGELQARHGPDHSDTLAHAGLGTFIGGAVLLVVAIPLLVASRTAVTADSGRRLARASKPQLTAAGLVF
jgi:hypothetical protein